MVNKKGYTYFVEAILVVILALTIIMGIPKSDVGYMEHIHEQNTKDQIKHTLANLELYNIINDVQYADTTANFPTELQENVIKQYINHSLPDDIYFYVDIYDTSGNCISSRCNEKLAETQKKYDMVGVRRLINAPIKCILVVRAWRLL